MPNPAARPQAAAPTRRAGRCRRPEPPSHPMAGKKGKSPKSFPRSAETRTTAEHAFKPPEHGGTVSQSRADRWQNANKLSTTAPASTASRGGSKAHWFSYAPSGPLPGRHGPHDVDPVRMGMSYPPQNPKVRKDLLAYLYARKVRMPSRSTVKKRPEQSASAPSFAQSTSLRRVASESPERTMLPKGNGINQRSKQKLGLPLLGDRPCAHK
ncbi:hypothetical protein AK812_SmicGene23297 [Symbiodinium microadriaticum]|uniref:Uncharacterized protein n=1 Tax=Symbiodinium microadriaticum TaxID=2951 RepID=A0A1Q9DHL9_SYMMI|nr:hypothetical protein AK812_SmicGene23297 [Symbiodinium microadriaticum]